MSTPLRKNPSRNDFEGEILPPPPLRTSMTEVPIPPIPSRRKKSRLEAGRNFCFVDSRTSCISFNIISILSDIVAFVIVATKPGNIIDLTISDQTANILLSLFLLCSFMGVIGGLAYDSALVFVPRFAYGIKAALSGLAGIFVANVATAAEHPATPSVVVSFIAVVFYSAASHAQGHFMLEVNAGIMQRPYLS